MKTEIGLNEYIGYILESKNNIEILTPEIKIRKSFISGEDCVIGALEEIKTRTDECIKKLSRAINDCEKALRKERKKRSKEAELGLLIGG